jgi:hypothetical protein
VLLDGIEGVWIQSIENLEGGSPVPLMAMQLQAIFQSVLTRPFRIGDYMGDMPFGRRDIIGPDHPTSAVLVSTGRDAPTRRSSAATGLDYCPH